MVRHVSNILKNMTFKVATQPYSYWVTKSINQTTGEAHYGGVCFNILDTLAASLKFRYTVIQPPDGAWGVVHNGTWTGMMGMIQRNEADIGINIFTMTNERFGIADFMAPYAMQETTFIVRAQPENFLLKCFQVLRWEVWLCITLAIIVSGVAMTIFQNLSPEPCAKKHQTANIFMDSYRTFFLQSIMIIPSSGRLHQSLWWLVCIIITAVYSGHLVAHLSVKKPPEVVDTIEELMDHQEIRIGVLANTAYEEYFRHMYKESTIPRYRAMWDRVELLYNVRPEDLQHRLLSEEFALVWTRDGLINLANIHQTLYIANDRFTGVYFSFPTSKTFPFMEKFNHVMLKILEAGLVEKWITQAVKEAHSASTQIESKSISLAHISGAFIGLFVGLGLSSLVFFTELALLNDNKCYML